MEVRIETNWNHPIKGKNDIKCINVSERELIELLMCAICFQAQEDN